MKIFTFLLLCSIIIFINAADSDKDCNGASASSAKDCKDLKLSGSGNHCCYSEAKVEYNGKTEKLKNCVELTDEEYNNIDDYIDTSKDEAKTLFNIKDLEVDCNSSFLTNSLLGIILFLL